MSKRITGARVVWERLAAHGVDTVFGYIGNNVIEIYDELLNYPKIRHITTAHEQGAAHAADGYARATGRPGVVIATSGPGACNLVTGIAAAYMDSTPMVVITGNVPTARLGHDSFQETDITGMTMGITKHNNLVRDANALADALDSAFAVAAEGRPGPVLVDVPRDVLQGTTTPSASRPPLPGGEWDVSDSSVNIPLSALNTAAALLQTAERPLMLVGGGAADAVAEVRALAKKLSLPVAHTLMGKGVLPDGHALSLGMAGLHGTPRAALALARCDVLLCVGSRLGERAAEGHGRAINAKIIHIDIDAAEINKNVVVDCPIVGDAAAALAALTNQVEVRRQDAWLETVARQPALDDSSVAARYMAAVNAHIKENTVVATDVGQHQMWAAQYLSIAEPRNWLTSGGLGAMGFGLGAAAGAVIARPDAEALHITGDGSFLMNAAELATVARYNLPVTTVIFNNRALGMVRQWQDISFSGRYSQIDLTSQPDFVKLAEAYGVNAARADTPGRLAKILHDKPRGPMVIDCAVPTETNVTPTWIEGVDVTR